MANKNNHFISKYLTRPWEVRPGWVTIFNYETNDFEEKETRFLFSKELIFTPEQEKFFNQHIETISRQELLDIHKNNFQTRSGKTIERLCFYCGISWGAILQQ